MSQPEIARFEAGTVSPTGWDAAIANSAVAPSLIVIRAELAKDGWTLPSYGSCHPAADRSPQVAPRTAFGQAWQMVVCDACGAENPEGARFCNGCAAPLAGAETHESRKTVTVVFCDLVGSTALGESRDPEVVRALLGRYFERMRAIVEAHGGSVEKFIGDAVVAVFGVPVVHEDDALRALRAAVEMREALPELELEARLGVNTGEIVTSGNGTLVTGDAMNVAARLQQMAGSGEILVGQPTLTLARNAVSVEELEPLTLKGKSEPVVAFRLLAVRETPERLHEAPLVGRSGELALLREAWRRVVEGEGYELLTIVGEPGVGKSRLVAEFVATLDARIVRGRCLSYGEAITYWPVVEVMKQLGSLPSDPAAARPLRFLLGESDESTLAEEIAWAFRKLLEQESPLLVVFDDIQWGEQTFLDLVEQLELMTGGAPVLLVCIARPEFTERRPQWPIGLRLEPLPATDVELLVPATVSAELRERIARVAGGNPLFVTEMVAMAVAAGDEVTVPPTLKALLAARLDQLAGSERSVLERGSVEGEVFHRGAVQALIPGETEVSPRLAALVRKQLIRPERPILPAEEGFRFCHLLMRDAAYHALPKKTRAELHVRFADWLDREAHELVERDELVGYHLEHAHRYRDELGQTDEANRVLGRRAADRLAAAAHRAGGRSDFDAVTKLLERALALGIADPRERVRLQYELGFALSMTRRPAEADAKLAETAEASDRLGEHGIAAQARVQRVWNRTGLPQLDFVEGQVIAEGAVETLTEVGDERGLALAHRLLGFTLARNGHSAAVGAEFERALAYAESCGDREMRRAAINTFANGYLSSGPTPAADAIERCEALLRSARGDRLLEATVKRPLALFHAMGAQPDRALELLREAGLVLDELTLRNMQTHRWVVGYARELAGDRLGAEQELQNMWLYFRNLRRGAIDTRGIDATVELARMYCDERRWEEAAETASYGSGLHLNDAWSPRVTRALTLEARLEAHGGRTAAALTLLERAIAGAEARAGDLTLRAQTWLAVAEVRRAAGEPADADAARATAIELYERKGNLAAASQARDNAS